MDPTLRGRLPDAVVAPPAPVLRDDRGPEPVWTVAAYDEAERMIGDPALYPTHRHEYGLDVDHLRQGPVNGAGLIAAEPDRHADLRALVARRFTPGAVRALRPRVEAVADGLV